MSHCVKKNLLALGAGLIEYVQTEGIVSNYQSKFAAKITRKKNETVLKS